MVTVNSGANSVTLALGGLTVGAVRADYAGLLNIAAGAKAFINGREVQDGALLSEGETLVFTQVTAEKG